MRRAQQQKPPVSPGLPPVAPVVVRTVEEEPPSRLANPRGPAHGAQQVLK